MPLMWKICCWRNAAAANCPRRHCPRPNAASSSTTSTSNRPIPPCTTASASTPRRTPMPRPDSPAPTRLDHDLADLKLLEIARCYREVLDDAARKGSSMLEVLNTLIGMEQAVRQQRALERRLRQARLPKQKTLAGYDFT